MSRVEPLNRREAVRALLARRADGLVVAGLGGSVWDTAAAGDSPLNLYLWGAMGSAATVGLGLAIAQPGRRVVVFTGDGEMLMGIGSLATIAAERPTNLAIVVLDNERFGETGMQATHTAAGVDLARVAEACGFPRTAVARDRTSLESVGEMIWAASGPALSVVKVRAERLPLVMPPRDGAYLKDRFRHALIGRNAVI